LAGWPEQAYLGLRAVLSMLLDQPLSARLVLVEAQGAGSEAIARYDAVIDSVVAWLGEGRRLYPAARDLPPTFEQAAVTGLAFYLQQCLLDSRPHTLEQLLDETAGLLLDPIVGAKTLVRLRRELAPA
jgi:hypothetical protein